MHCYRRNKTITFLNCTIFYYIALIAADAVCSHLIFLVYLVRELRVLTLIADVAISAPQAAIIVSVNVCHDSSLLEVVSDGVTRMLTICPTTLQFN